MNATTATHTARLAAGLLAAYTRNTEADLSGPRTHAAIRARAEYLGMCKGAALAGYGPTETAVMFDVMDAVRAAGPAPAYGIVTSDARRAWNTAAITILTSKLDGA